MPEFFLRYGTQVQCAAALLALRWPQGFCCPRCSSAEHCGVGHGARKRFQCRGCRRQTSLTAGTVMDSTKLPLTTGFLAIYRVSQDKAGLSALALMRHLDTSYRTAWLIHQKLMKTMALRGSEQPLTGAVQVDDAYPGGERPGASGRGLPNKVPIAAAVSTNDRGHPMQVKLRIYSPPPHHRTSDGRRWGESCAGFGLAQPVGAASGSKLGWGNSSIHATTARCR